MQAFSGFVQETITSPFGEAQPIDFSTVKGVYKNCRGIWAAQWTDEKGQRHTKYFNPKFFANEQTARVEAYKFKVAIQREIEAKGGVQRKRPHTVRARQSACRRAEYELLPTSGRRIRRSGSPHSMSFSNPYGPDYSNASPELLAMLQSVNVAGLGGDPAVTEPILTWQSGMMTTSPGSLTGMRYHGMLQPSQMPWNPLRSIDSLYRTGESVDGAQLSERMLEGFTTTYWPAPPPQYTTVCSSPAVWQQYDEMGQCFEAPAAMESWWARPAADQAKVLLCSEPLRKSADERCISHTRSAPPPVVSQQGALHKHPAKIAVEAAQLPGITPMFDGVPFDTLDEASLRCFA